MTGKKATKQAAEVASYLAANPDFFVNRDELLLKMQVPHRTKGSVSLLEKQIALLRERQRKGKGQMETLIATAKGNLEVFDKCQRLVLNLMAAGDRDAFFSALEKGLRRDLKCRHFSLAILGKAAEPINQFAFWATQDEVKKRAGALLRSKAPTLGPLKPDERDFLFGKHSKKVNSAAALPVRSTHNQQMALLVLGSDDPNYFAPDMDTLFLQFIADSIARLLPRHLDLGRDILTRGRGALTQGHD